MKIDIDVYYARHSNLFFGKKQQKTTLLGNGAPLGYILGGNDYFVCQDWKIVKREGLLVKVIFDGCKLLGGHGRGLRGLRLATRRATKKVMILWVWRTKRSVPPVLSLILLYRYISIIN